MNAVVQINPDTLEVVGRFKSLAEAQRHLADTAELSGKNIRSVCYRGSIFTSGGFLWRYANDIELELPSNEYRKSRELQNRKKPVAQIDPEIDDLVISVYDSAFDATKATNISRFGIVEVCKGRRKTAGGYRWIYI